MEPSVVLVKIPQHDTHYPPLAESARVAGRVTVRVGVRPDGSVEEITTYPNADLAWKLLHGAAVDIAALASFECRGCTQSSTPHTIAFVFSFEGFDSTGNPRPPAWKQTGNASSEVTIFGRVTILGGGGGTSQPYHVRAARCLWLWRCSKEAYVRSIM